MAIIATSWTTDLPKLLVYDVHNFRSEEGKRRIRYLTVEC